jgi:hypothetical protein
MLRRVSVAVVVAGTLGVGGGEAVADTWDDAAARVDYGVYAPARTLGLKPSVETYACTEDDTALAATYRKRGRKARLLFYEGSPYVCGNPGESMPVKTVRIDGRRVTVSVFCRLDGRRCTVANGRRAGGCCTCASARAASGR